MLENLIRNYFKHTPTVEQERLIEALVRFVIEPAQDKVFIINGYAGTGKTSLISALVKALDELELETVLFSPTGRAAKVLANYSGKKAFTIHKKIYKLSTSGDGMAFRLMPNKHRDTLFIVDEASMIGDGSSMINQGFKEQSSLLEDLLFYTCGGYNCKLIMIGDEAQLPPVGIDLSPALNVDYLRAAFHLDIEYHQLTEVVRQAEDSGILSNATAIRHELTNSNFSTLAQCLTSFPDVVRVSGADLEDALNSSYSFFGKEDMLVVCRSNKRANIYNQQIRNRIFFQEDEISTGDFLMVVKNNYFWLPETSDAGFIANGDIVEIMKVRRYEDIYGLRFAEVTIRLIDYPDEPTLDVKILLNTINSESASLTYQENRQFFETVMEDYADIPSKSKKMAELKKNPYYNSLQVKFAYAVTCHKSQGGQWPCVFVDQGYLTDEMINTEYYRWLYTAVTRATQKLYLINFKDEFWGSEFCG